MPLAVKRGIGEGGTLQHSNSKIVKDARDLRGHPATPSVMPNDKHQNAPQSQIRPRSIVGTFLGFKTKKWSNYTFRTRISLSSSSILHHFF